MRRIAALLLLFLPAASGWENKSTPFSAVRWQDHDAPVVLLDGEWFRLVSLQGVPVGKILAHCRRRHEEKWQKRFVEDLGQVLDEMGVPSASDVDLVLATDKKKTVRRKGVRMTRALRERALAAGYDLAFADIRRKHPLPDDRELRALARRVEVPGVAGDELTARQVGDDLDDLETILEHRYSYLRARGVDYRGALDAIRGGVGDGIPRWTFANQLRRFFALFGDGHSGVAGRAGRPDDGRYLPFLIGEEKGKLFLIEPDRRAIFHAEEPFVAEIDGRPVAEWLEAASRLVARGAPHTVRERARRHLRELGYLQRELGLPERDEVAIGFESGATERVRLTRRRPIYGSWPRTRTRRIDEVGYLRIPRMEGGRRALAGLEAAMHDFRGTKGLIVDVRGNGGGSRELLRVLFGYLLADHEAPHVGNVAAYRLPPGRKESRDGHLANRFLFPAGSPDWNVAARKAIRRCAKGFKPEWKLPAGEFTAWHYLVLDRSAAARPYHYDQPVVVLLDTACFSATDIFLGALQGRPGVTLLGLASGGGSGRTRGYGLPHSGIRFRISSMASFRPDGRRYDGRGIEPDVVVEPARSDWIGRGDRQLDAALALLAK